MEHLNNIIAEISQIEDQATMLMASANDQKDILAKAHEIRIKEYDETLQQETQLRIAKTRQELQDQNKKDLDGQRAKTLELLDAMQLEFEKAHNQIASNIVKSMIGA